MLGFGLGFFQCGVFVLLVCWDFRVLGFLFVSFHVLAFTFQTTASTTNKEI